MGTAARAASLLAAGLLLVGCSAARGAGSELHGEWRLVQASDRQGPMDMKGATVTLSIERDSARGDGPCNILQLTIDGGPGSVGVNLGAITERACLDQDLMAIEGRYVAALGGVTTAEVTGATLTLSGVRGTLEYTRS